MRSDALTMDAVCASYGQGLVLDDVTMSFPVGKTTAILGANGAGKSTTLNIIAGTLKPIGGRLLDHDGNELTSRSGLVRPRVAMSPEGRRLFGQMTVEENLLLGAFKLRHARPAADKMAEIFDLFPRVAERRRQLAGTLSGGEQQMVAIGRALMREPEILLLDEPTLGLSPRIAGTVSEMIARIAGEGLTIVLVEQDAGMALTLAQRAYVLVNGRVTASGAAKDMDPEQILNTYFDTDSEKRH